MCQVEINLPTCLKDQNLILGKKLSSHPLIENKWLADTLIKMTGWSWGGPDGCPHHSEVSLICTESIYSVWFWWNLASIPTDHVLVLIIY